MNLKNKKSKKAFEKACKYIPGGVNSPVRAFGSVDVDPLFIKKGKGCRIWDIDGNEYIDYVGSWGPMILGHNHPAVIKAVKKQLKKGMSFGAATKGEVKLAKMITEAVESIDKVRMVNSGTEAVMTAIRLARAYTGKDMILKMVGCYHGHSDPLLISAGSGIAEFSEPSSPGVPKDAAKHTVAVQYNDIEAVKKAFDIHKNKIAAVIIEPVAANMGVILPEDGYLKSLRKICDENDTLLIFDEVITGFRLTYGGAQDVFGVKPDLTCLGKIIGGGLPAAAFGGKKEIMDMLAPKGNVYQAGTLSGNPLATAAAVATLKMLKKRDFYQKIAKKGEFIENSFKICARNTGISVRVNRIGSLLSCFFTDKPVKNFLDVQKSDTAKFKKFFAEMLNNGIYLAASPYEAMFISQAHEENDLNKTINAIEQSFKVLK